MSEVRSRKKTDKNASQPPGENKVTDTRGSLQSFSAALEGLRQEVSGDQNLLATYEHLLQTELTKKVPSLSCHLWYLCKLFLKVLWILFLLLIVAGVVVYNVDRLSDAAAIYMQEHMYDYMRMFRFTVLALCPYFPRLLKPCLILNPFSPASKCACLDGVVIRNASIADAMSDDSSVIFHPQLLNPARSGTVDVYALRKLYYKGLDDMSDPCAEFASEEEENPDDLYYHDLFMSLTDLKEYMQSNRPLKSTWYVCVCVCVCVCVHVCVHACVSVYMCTHVMHARVHTVYSLWCEPIMVNKTCPMNFLGFLPLHFLQPIQYIHDNIMRTALQGSSCLYCVYLCCECGKRCAEYIYVAPIHQQLTMHVETPKHTNHTMMA